jgi:hypothetical protein
MKTPREILFARHQNAGAKLDAIRVGVLSTESREGRRVAVPKFRVAGAATLPMLLWREFLFSFRWHLVGLGAVWAIIALLNVGSLPGSTVAIAAEKNPSPQKLFAALRENRQQLLELIGPPVNEPATAPLRRSGFQSQSMVI